VRILAERLCLICQMREATHSQSRISDSMSRIQQLSAKLGGQQSASHAARPSSQQNQQQHATASSSQPPKPSPPSKLSNSSLAPVDSLRHQPTPEADSTTSTQEVLTVAAVAGGAAQRHPQYHGRPPPAAAPAASNAESLQKVLDHAKQVSRFAGLMRRSPIGFQSFMERPDYRDSQPAKLASMHIATISVDMGMVDGFSLIAHAHRARICIAALCR
jgi:hypothetical protein